MKKIPSIHRHLQMATFGLVRGEPVYLERIEG